MPGANLRDTQALEDLKGALARFGGDAKQALQAAAMEARRAVEWLDERAHHWQAEVARRRTLFAQAEYALRACLASGDREHPPSCGAFEQRLVEARVFLARAEAELRSVQEWTRVARQAYADYDTEARRLGSLIGDDLPRAEALLQRKIDTLADYLAMGAPAGGVSVLFEPPTILAPQAGQASSEPSNPRGGPVETSGSVEQERDAESIEGGGGGPERGG